MDFIQDIRDAKKKYDSFRENKKLRRRARELKEIERMTEELEYLEKKAEYLKMKQKVKDMKQGLGFGGAFQKFVNGYSKARDDYIKTRKRMMGEK